MVKQERFPEDFIFLAHHFDIDVENVTNKRVPTATIGLADKEPLLIVVRRLFNGISIETKNALKAIYNNDLFIFDYDWDTTTGYIKY